MVAQLLMSILANLALRSPSWSKPAFIVGLRLMRMPLTALFVDYAIDFEVAYATDDWSVVGRHFTPDATYRVSNSTFDCELRQPENIVLGFKRSLDGFDRRLKRSLKVVDGPSENASMVTFIWAGRYDGDDCPSLELSAKQTAHYRDGLIELLTDEYLPGYGDTANQWIHEYNPSLDPSYCETELANQQSA